MSIETIIRCDVCGQDCCGRHRNKETPAQQRARGALRGWQRKGKSDYCATCWEEKQRTERAERLEKGKEAS